MANDDQPCPIRNPQFETCPEPSRRIRNSKELALALYQRGALSLGKARALAQMTRWEFEELLGQRRITRHYTRVDLEEDIQFVAQFGLQPTSIAPLHRMGSIFELEQQRE